MVLNQAPLDGGGPLSTALKRSSDSGLGTLLAGLPADYRKVLHEKLGDAALAELSVLGAESDFGLFSEQGLRLAGRLEAEQQTEASVALLQALLPEIEAEGGSFPGLRARAERDLQAILGRGGFGARFEFLARRFAREASDPWMIAGFGAGSLAFKTAKLGVLSRLAGGSEKGFFLGRVGAGLLASGAGLTAEVPVFVFTSKFGRELTGTPQDWRAATLGHELAATGLTLFCLKGTGALSGKAFNALHGIDRNLLAVRELGAFTRFAQGAVPQLGMFGGIVLARRVEEWVGLRPHLDGATLFTDSLATYFQFLVGGRLAERALGPGFRARQRELDLRARNFETGASLMPDFAMQGWTPAAVLSAGRPPRASLSEILSAPLMSENQNGDGTGNGSPGGPRLRSVSPGEQRVAEANTPVPDPQAFAEEVRVKIREERQLVSEAMNALRSMSAQVQTFMIHAEQGRGSGPELRELRQGILATYDRFLQKYLVTSRSHQASIPLTVGAPAVQAEAVRSRAETQRFLQRVGQVHREAQKVLNEVAAENPEGIRAALRGLHQKIPELNGKSPTWALQEGLSPREERLFAKLSGVLQGVGVKEAYRAGEEDVRTAQEFQLHPWHLLSRSSPRFQDHQIPEWLLAELRSFEGRDWDPVDTLIVRAYPSAGEVRDTAAREVSPREILRWGGAYHDPFRTWIGIQLPTLLAAYRGDFRTFSNKTRALEIFMEPKTREATQVAAWWLSKALHGDGYPHEWAREPEASPIADRARRLSSEARVDPARAVRLLGEAGDMAAVGHALFAFLKHPFEARAALERALNAPEAVREDVVSLTGALLGAFHGKGAFHPEWMVEVILRSVPTRQGASAVRDVTEFINKEVQLQNALEDLRSFSIGEGKTAKISPLRTVSARAETPAWRAFRAGYEERYHNGEMVAVETIWDAALKIEDAREKGIYPKEWKTLHRHLRTSIHRMEAALESMRAFRSRGEAALQTLGSGAGAEAALADFDLKTARLEKTLSAFSQLREVMEEAWPRKMVVSLNQDTYRQLRGLILDAIGNWDSPGFEALQQSVADPLRIEDLRALQQGAVFIGRSVRPPFLAPFFEARSDSATVAAVLKGYAEYSPLAPPSAENLMESYLQAVGSSFLRYPGSSLANQISPSALFAVVTPAYLEANLRNPARALRELATLPSAESPELRDAWRVATYAALRLMQGAEPNLALLQELRRSFVDSTMVQGLNRLINLQVEADAATRERALLEWEASPDVRNRVLLGLHAFLQSPRDLKGAVQAVSFSAVDPHQVAERVAGMLAEVHRSRNPLATKPAEVLRFGRSRVSRDNDVPPSSKRIPMTEKDMTATLGSAFDPRHQGTKVEAFWREWAEQLGAAIEPREAEAFRKNLDKVPGYFQQNLSYYAATKPLLAKVLMVKLGILPPQSSVSADPELRSALLTKARDAFSAEDWQGHSNGILYSYRLFAKQFFPESYRPLGDAERLEWHEKIGDLPAIVVEGINAGGLQSANFLLLVHRFGLSRLGTPERDEIPED